MPIAIRPVTEDELEEFFRVAEATFGGHPHEGRNATERTVLELDRTLAAFDGDEPVAVACSYRFSVSLPGGADVPVAGIASVGVLPTHRRQGLLRRLLGAQLDDVAARGEAGAVLTASEGTIYGRFGFGPACFGQRVVLDRRAAALARPVPGRPPLRLVPQAEALEVIAPLYEAHRAVVPGSIAHDRPWWRIVLGDEPQWKGGGPVFVVVAEAGGGPAGDEGGGYAIYEAHTNRSAGERTVVVRDLVALGDATRAALWDYLLGVDLVDRVEWERAPVDDPLRWWLTDPRQPAVAGLGDKLWLRILDIPAVLGGRRYPVDGSFVVEVADPTRPGAAGRYQVTGGPGGAECRTTDEAADLVLDIADLGSLALGGVAVRDLARAGRVVPGPGAGGLSGPGGDPAVVDAATAFFTWPVAPHCLTRF